MAQQLAQFDANAATGSDTVGQDPRGGVRQNDSNGRGSQGGADSQQGGGQPQNQGQAPNESLRAMVQAAGAGPSGGASVGPEC